MSEKINNVPNELRQRRQWVLWKYLRGAKVPFQVTGSAAATTKPEQWADLDDCRAAGRNGGYVGLGYVFSPGDPYVGIDLDDCRDLETGKIEPWANEIIRRLNTYCEISPSGTGVKLWARGEYPGDGSGRKVDYNSGAVEIYDHSRYFCVTGNVLGDVRPIRDAQPEIDWLMKTAFSDDAFEFPGGDMPGDTADAIDYERARAAIEKIDESVEGDGGSNRMLEVCCTLLRHGIDGDEAWEHINWYNENRCSPPWSSRELEHKWKSAQDKVMRGQEFGIDSTTTPEGTKKGRRRFDLEPIDLVDFRAMSFQMEFLVDGVLVSGQHCMIGGPKKALKTSFALDLSLSLATGTPFLGHFDTKQTNSLIISGESGGAAIQATCERIIRARDLTPNRGQHTLSFNLPQISIFEHLAELKKVIVDRGIGFAAIDPAYLCTVQNADDTKNVFAMGMILQGLGDLGVETGCTMALIHHTKKPRQGDSKAPELSDLSYSGFAEWARQWLLVRPDRPMQAGKHQLRMAVGGSAGHFGDWTVNVDEGEPGLTGRIWSIEVSDREPDDEEKPAAVDEAKSQEALSAIVTSPGISRKKLKETLGVGLSKLDRLVAKLGDQIEVIETARGSQTYLSYTPRKGVTTPPKEGVFDDFGGLA